MMRMMDGPIVYCIISSRTRASAFVWHSQMVLIGCSRWQKASAPIGLAGLPSLSVQLVLFPTDSPMLFAEAALLLALLAVCSALQTALALPVAGHHHLVVEGGDLSCCCCCQLC